MPGSSLPYEPIPQQLYDRAKLFQGFKPGDSTTYRQTADFAVYRHYVMEGRGASPNPYFGMMQALHDNAITQLVNDFIAGKRVAAVMGDHKLARDSAAYKTIALLARRLTRNGILISTGGGPGAMEAGHLGASLAAEPESRLEEALALLRTKPVVPALMGIVDAQGRVNPVLQGQAHAWFKPAFEIASSIQSPSQSLAFPTWHYGHEPTTPLATHIAKYFQNSIREDGLLAFAKDGIVYFEGKAGTIQEIFQDAAQNFYRSFGYFSPMVLFGAEYWTKKFPVTAFLQTLFSREDFRRRVLVTDEVEEAAKFVESFKP
jgi:predicted Rossmann-fold nucleotide-binding protein